MADIVGRVIKPATEFIEDFARRVPEALGKGHHRIGEHVHNAANVFDKAEDDLTAKAGHHPHDFGDGHHDPADVAGTGATAAAGAAGGAKAVGDAEHQAARTGSAPDRDNLRPGDSDHAALPGGEKHCETDPVDVATGDMIMPAVDVALPGALPLLLERTHISSYRQGRLSGASWASTLDQRLQLDADSVVFASADGMRLEYPPPHADRPVLPLKGPRLPLLWSGVHNDPMTVLDPRSGHALVFDEPRPAPGVPNAVTLRLTAIEDRNGRRIDIEWSARDLPELVTHHGGYRIAVDAHPDLPRITAFRLLDTDGPGTSTTLARYGHNTAGDLTEVYNSSGTPLRLTYDAEHRITSWTDRVGTEYHYTYDAAGRVVRTTGSGGTLSSTFAYDDETRTTRFTNSLGHTTTHQHNDAYRLIRSTDPLGDVTVQEWSDDNRLLTSVTDPLGRVTRLSYDGNGQITGVVHPDGTAATVARNALGLPTAVTDAGGGVWRTEYDERGNRVASVDPLGARSEYVYGPEGHLAAVTDPLGKRSAVSCDAAGLQTSLTDPAGRRTTAVRDAFGRVVAATDPLGNAVRLGWTPEGRVAWCRRADGRTEHWEYDAEGNTVAYTDAEGATTRYAYAGFDQPAAVTNPDGARYAFAHDSELRLTGVTGPTGLAWEYAYDPVGRRVWESDFEGRTLTYAYDAAGQLLTRTGPSGETTSYSRDLLGRVVEILDGGRRTSYAYDGAGNLCRLANEHGEIVRAFDLVGRFVSETSDGRTMRYGYDLMGRTTWRRTPSGIVSTWTYDEAGQPGELEFAGGRTTFAHDALGRETERVFGTGVTIGQVWDGTGRMIEQSVALRAEPGRAGFVRQREYAYRGGDDLLTEIRDLTSGTRTFELDTAGRVTALRAPDRTEFYAYDALGNLSASDPGTGDPESAWQSPGPRPRRAGRTSYRYDDAGRIVRTAERLLNGQVRIRQYEWNSQDQLVAVTTPDGDRWTYRYDALGRRTAKERTTSAGKPVERTDFSWAGSRLAEQSRSDGTALTWEYRPGSHRPLAQVESRADSMRCHAIVTDLVGTPTELVTPDGDIAWQARTNALGCSGRCPPSRPHHP